MLLFNCPHCNDIIIIFENELNCRIFRHGVYKHNYQQINPHLSKDQCDKIINDIYGCGKPFKIIDDLNTINKYNIVICDYI